MWTYSHTHEGRDMVVFAVSDEATIPRLEEFRREHGRRLDPRGRPPEEDRAVLEPAKAVAWLAYSIHGDELSGTDAAAAVAYWLVAGEDERTRRLRDELVILIDPCQNPDGRERFLAQTTSFAHSVPNPDTEDLSHTTVWPWGRGNHYLFDLNRDWFSQVQPESVRSTLIAAWKPQLVVDAHEMGSHSTYLFSPPRHPFNPFAPEYAWEWRQRFAAGQARELDRRGYTYYTREWNEEFFPGYGSTWAEYRGAVGILYEMASTEGTLIQQRRGTVRTHAQAVEHQAASSIANLQTLVENRTDLLIGMVGSRREAIRQGREGRVGAWILPAGRHPERTAALVALLGRQGVEVLRATTEPPRVSGLRDARTGETVPASALPATTWMVPLDQPAGRVARVLLDPHLPMEAEFLREEREYLERGRGTRLYEVTCWSLPLAYGVEAYWTPERPADGWTDEPAGRSAEPGGSVESLPQAVGYVMEGTSDPSVSALADLLGRGLTVQIAGRPFRLDAQEYDRGAVLLMRDGNPANLEEILASVAERWQVDLQAVPTSLAQEGPDLGGRHFHTLVPPRVGVWTGAPVSPSAYGALWSLLDGQMQVRFSGLDLSRFRVSDLQRYNVLIFPPVRRGAESYRAMIGTEGLARLKRWLEAGGTAVGIGGGAEFLADRDLELTRTRLRRQALDRYPPAVLGASAEEVDRAGVFRATGVRAAEDPDGDDDHSDDEKRAARRPPRSSPHDIAPLIGPGARPFTEGVDLGTPAAAEPVSLADWLAPFLPPGRTKPEDEDLKRADERLRRFAPRGAFLRVDLDPEIWLSWGLPETLPVLTRTRGALVAEPPVEVAARYADPERLHLGGLLWPEAAGRVARTAYVTREAVGRGQVILFLSEPEFRGWTLGSRRLLLNAILYGPGLGTRWSTPW
jgi:hypothetical protein